MLLAVLFARAALEKHGQEYSQRTPGRKGLGRHYKRFGRCEPGNPSETHAAVPRKNQNWERVAEVGLGRGTHHWSPQRSEEAAWSILPRGTRGSATGTVALPQSH